MHFQQVFVGGTSLDAFMFARCAVTAMSPQRWSLSDDGDAQRVYHHGLSWILT
jgi:hypothetical protein